MFRYTLVDTALAFALASPVRTETIFLGTLCYTAVTAACTNGPFQGSFDSSLFHPKAVPGNLNFSALNEFRRTGTTSRNLDSASFTAVFQQVTNARIGFSNFTSSKLSFVLVGNMVPGALTASTRSVTPGGKIKNPRGDTGQEACIASLRFVRIRDLNS
jgi:hypothetical protein